MGILSFFQKRNDNNVKVGGMEDYMMLIRVYFQAAIAAQVGINNIAMLPDLRVFKTTFKVHTEHNRLGTGEKNACRKMQDVQTHFKIFNLRLNLEHECFILL